MILRILIALFGLGVLSVGGGMFLFVGPPESEIPQVTLAEFEQTPHAFDGWFDLVGYRLGDESVYLPNPVFDDEEFGERAIPLRPLETTGNDSDAVVALIMTGLSEDQMRAAYGSGRLRVNRATVLGQPLDDPLPEQLLDLENSHPDYDWAAMVFVSEHGVGPIGAAIPITILLIGAFLVLAPIVLMRKKKRRGNDFDEDWRGAPPPLR